MLSVLYGPQKLIFLMLFNFLYSVCNALNSKTQIPIQSHFIPLFNNPEASPIFSFVIYIYNILGFPVCKPAMILMTCLFFHTKLNFITEACLSGSLNDMIEYTEHSNTVHRCIISIS